MTEKPIPLPDHPIRKHWAWQVYARGYRPAAGWFAALSILYQGVVSVATGRYPPTGFIIAWGGIVLVILGYATIEKIWKVR